MRKSTVHTAIPKVSIIIPTYNSESFLPMCLGGINALDYPKEKVEVLVVDNNSSDSTREIAKKFGAEVLIEKGKPPRVCYQRNMGVAKATGEYVFILDHDMELSPTLLKTFAKSAAAHPDVAAWYVPERIVSHNVFMDKI